MMKFEKKIVGYIKCIILRMMYANFVINWPGQLVCKGGGGTSKPHHQITFHWSLYFSF